MRITFIIVAVTVGLGLAVWIIGSLLPVEHRVTSEATFTVPPDTLFSLISTPMKFPEWRKDVKAVELLPPSDGVERYREISGDGTILYSVVRSIPGRERVIEIADPNLPFGGRWTFVVAPASAGTTSLRITEDGEVRNPIYRFVSRLVVGHRATIDRYLADMKRHFEERK